MVKIWVDDRDGKYKKLTPALYGAIIDEAHKHNLRVTAHIVTLEDAKGLLRAGLDGFAHSVRDKDIDDEFVALVKQRPNLFQVPNLPDRGVKADLELAERIRSGRRAEEAAELRPPIGPPVQTDVRHSGAQSGQDECRGNADRSGNRWQRPMGPHLEMEDMVAAGMTPAQVIVAATRNGAELLSLTDLGTVAAGKSADFIVLDANPLDDITNTRKISAVYLRGAAVDRAAVRARMTGGKT